MIDAGRRMHEETHTQTSDLDNNSRDDICECNFILLRQLKFAMLFTLCVCVFRSIYIIKYMIIVHAH